MIAKLYSYRDKDLADITSGAVTDHLNWDLLDHLATAEDDAKANALNEYRYREFLDNYAAYRRRYHP